MSDARFRVVPSVYLFLTRQVEGRTGVLLQQRSGTGYMDRWWAAGAAGHVERGESAPTAAGREAGEELGVTVAEPHLDLVAVLHRTIAGAGPGEERLDLFFEVRQWRGDPSIQEPDKASDLQWWPLDGLPEQVVPHERQALEHLRTGQPATTLTRGFDQHLTLIAAMGSNRVIGDGHTMPWHLPEDLAFFKQTTTGGTLIMGRGTWDSIGRALPGRRTIVLTRDQTWTAPGAVVAHSLAEALLIAGEGEIFIAGGGDLYAQTIEIADRLLVTEVDQAPAGSVLFPPVDPGRWREVSRRSGPGLDWVDLRTLTPSGAESART